MFTFKFDDPVMKPEFIFENLKWWSY